jgi:hypothetical protein
LGLSCSRFLGCGFGSRDFLGRRFLRSRFCRTGSLRRGFAGRPVCQVGFPVATTCGGSVASGLFETGLDITHGWPLIAGITRAIAAARTALAATRPLVSQVTAAGTTLAAARPLIG